MRMKQLDALRAISILLVMVEHYGGRVINDKVPFGAGFIGVGCFFVLSGFLITGLFLENLDRQKSTLKVLAFFYMRRFLRLLPPLYLMIAVLVLFGIEPVASSWWWHALYLTNFWIAAGNPINVFWTLAVEEQFYVLWPFVLIFVPRRRLLTVTLCLILFGWIFQLCAIYLKYDQVHVMVLLPSNFGLLGLGCIASILSYNKERSFDLAWFDRKAELWIGLVAVALICIELTIESVSGSSSAYQFLTKNLALGVGFTWIVLKTAKGWTGYLGFLFELKPLNFIGRISYGLYIYHNFINKILQSFFPSISRMALLISTLSLLLSVSTLSWYIIEKPILRLKKFFPVRHSNLGLNVGPPTTF